jgi:hypothetical protein
MNRLVTISLISAILVIAGAVRDADAVVYCKTVGIPKGCVVRQPATVGAPGAGVRPDIGAGAVGVGVRPGVGVGGPGVGVNAGGPVNRVGVR